MEKLRLNNEIVSMRHSVRKTQVHVIHKLTREINRLKNRKGSEKQVEKCKRKAERLKDELNIIKRIKLDDVSKFAIKNTRSLEEILTDLQSSYLERALGRLACHPEVLSHIKKLRAEPVDWVALLDDLGSRTREKKKKKKSKDSTEIGTFEPGYFVRIRHSSSNEDINSEFLNNNKSCLESDDLASHTREKKKILKYTKETGTFEPGRFVRIRHSTSNEDINSELINNNDSFSVSDGDSEYAEQYTEYDSGVRDSVSSVKNTENSKNRNVQQSNIQKSKQDIHSTSFSLSKEFSYSSDENSDHSSGGDLNENCSSSTNINSLQPDPFFLTDKGEYLSSIVKDDVTDDVTDDNKTAVQKMGISNGWSTRVNERMKRNHKVGGYFKNGADMPRQQRHKLRLTTESKRKHKINDRKTLRGGDARGNSIAKQKDSLNESSVSLHPSWEAKKKLQQQQLNIHAFQGKKITFDDD